MRSDAAVMRFIGDGRPESRETVWSRLLRAAGHWPFVGYGMWCVTEKVSGRYAGDVGFMQLKRDMVPPLGDVPEIGWVLANWAHGQGFAAEAIAASLAWSDTHLDAPATTCIIVPEHERSIRVASQAGYVQSGTADYKCKAVNVYRRSRDFHSPHRVPKSGLAGVYR